MERRKMLERRRIPAGDQIFRTISASEGTDGGDDGITLRDRFAMMAMATLLNDQNLHGNDGMVAKEIARRAYQYGDALMAARATPGMGE